MITWTEKENLGNGIYRYGNIIKKDFNIIDRLESVLSDKSPSNLFGWQPAFVGYRQLMPDYRDCVDFKFKKEHLEHDKSENSIALQNIWQDVFDAELPAVQDYCRDFNIMELKYWEAFNFVKYEPGHHFMEHHDHGFSYNCTVSLVAYINDDYDGGELYFRLQNLNVKPKAGDLFIFPSNYMYPHRAMPVRNGTKYSIVTMLDYNKKFHTNEMYQPDED